MHATIIMEGRLVTDPEIKSGKNGDYCTFRFVVNTKYGNQDNASFFNCTASEYIANRMQKAGIKKGRLIEIIGNLNLRPYETDEGIRQISADVGVLEWHFTGSKPKGDEADSSQGTAKTAQKSTGTIVLRAVLPKGKKVRGYRVFREVCASQVSFEFFYHSERPPFTMILYRVPFTAL